MKAARATALLSYRHYDTYGKMQARPEGFLVESAVAGNGTGAGGGAGSGGDGPAADEGGTAGDGIARGETGVAGDGAASYQRYQGEKLARRFNAFSYYTLSLSMDSHDIGRGRGGLEEALGRVKAKTLVISIETDILFPPSEQELLAELIPGAAYRSIGSLYGHDGFLLEYEQIERLVSHFILEFPNGSRYAREHYPGLR
jgi:homoserine O-acetyltransferase